MTEMHYSGPFQLSPGPPPPGTEEYEPNYELISRYLVNVADTVLAAGRSVVTVDAVLRNPEMRELEQLEAEHLLSVLEQAGLVGPADAAGRRTVLVTGRKAKTVMTKVKAIAAVATQLRGSAPLGSFEEFYQ